MLKSGSLDHNQLISPTSGNIQDVNQPEKIEVSCVNLTLCHLTICQLCDGDLTAVFQEPERPTKIMNAHIEKAGLDDLQIVKALGAGGFGLVKLVKVKGQPLTVSVG